MLGITKCGRSSLVRFRPPSAKSVFLESRSVITAAGCLQLVELNGRWTTAGDRQPVQAPCCHHWRTPTVEGTRAVLNSVPGHSLSFGVSHSHIHVKSRER